MACCDPYRKNQIEWSDKVEKKAAKFVRVRLRSWKGKQGPIRMGVIAKEGTAAFTINIMRGKSDGLILGPKSKCSVKSVFGTINSK